MASVTILPSAPHTHTVVFLHGRGDTAESFCSSLTYSTDSQNRTLRELFPSFRWVFPQAKISESITLGNKIPQWFDIWNVNDFSEREELQGYGLAESVIRIKALLESEVSVLGGQWDRIILAGISQGGATCVHTLLNLNLPPTEGNPNPRLGAFLGFSCRMPFPGRTLLSTRKVLDLDCSPYSDKQIQNTPILLEHCVDDPVVLIEKGRELRDTLLGFRAQVIWKEYPDGGHWINSPKGIDDVVEFLNREVLNYEGTERKLPLTDAMDLS